jgi:hypothetical protein
MVVYGEDAGVPWPSRQQAMLVTGSGGTYLAQIVQSDPSDGCQRSNLSISLSGTNLTATPECGDPFDNDSGAGATTPYTATSTTLSVFIPQDDGAIALENFTLQ